MNEILRLLKEAFGIRPLVPILLIIVIGFIFKTRNKYPISELFYDRLYLISCVMILSLSISYFIYTSGLAKRTPVGRYGVYIGYFKNDPDRSLHSRVFEALKANLDAKTYAMTLKINVRSLGKEIKDDDIEKIDKMMDKLNAAVMIWGSAVDQDLLYPRIWSHSDIGEPRSFAPVKVSELSNLMSFSESVWERIESISKTSKEKYINIAHLSERIDQLENKLQNTSIRIGRLISEQITAENVISPPETHAILVGIGEYPGPLPALRGPKNDVFSMKEILLARNPNSKINVLLDKQATKKNIIENIFSIAREIDKEKTLLIYLSGHGTISSGVSFYFPSDIQFENNSSINSIDLTNFVEDIIKLHARTIFIFDTPFDSTHLKADLIEDAALMIGGPAPNLVFEAYFKDKAGYMGAFTAALVQAFNNVPNNTSVKLRDLFNRASIILRAKFPTAKPYLWGRVNSVDSLSL